MKSVNVEYRGYMIEKGAKNVYFVYFKGMFTSKVRISQFRSFLKAQKYIYRITTA